MAWLTRLIGIVAVALVVLGGVIALSDSASTGTSSGSEHTGFDVFETPAAFSAEIREASPVARDATGLMVTDDFVLAIVSWMLFLFLAVVIWHRGSSLGHVAAVVVVAGASAAVVLDWLVSADLHFVLNALSRGADVTGVMRAAHHYDVVKWWWVFLATGALSPLFFRTDDVVMWGLGGTLLISTVTGACGLLWYPEAVEWAFTMLIPVDLGLAWICFSAPDLLVPELHRA